MVAQHFNPRSPSGLRRLLPYRPNPRQNISIHAARVGCDNSAMRTGSCCCISIHAARVGCDNGAPVQIKKLADFNPRSPSGLRRSSNVVKDTQFYFNPRSPSGLRRISKITGKIRRYFNPRSPSGLRHQAQLLRYINSKISIHAARVGCDTQSRKHRQDSLLFQSTQPEWAATWEWRLDMMNVANFNPRSPSGLRHTLRYKAEIAIQISIHAARVGCDNNKPSENLGRQISIHAARVGCDAFSKQLMSAAE